jgi:CubicO group peptidase (beta-lactamase class C family)
MTLLPILLLLIAPAHADVAQSSVDSARAKYGWPGLIVGALDSESKFTGSGSGVKHLGQSARMSASDRFPIGSATKTFTAMLMMQLLEDPASGVTLQSKLPELLPAGFPMHAQYKSVTLEMLMNHLAGLPGESTKVSSLVGSRATRLDLAKALLAKTWPYPVGKSHYSTFGFEVVGTILEHKTGQTWETLLETKLVKPLGLDCGTGFKSGQDPIWGHDLDEHPPAPMNPERPGTFLSPLMNPGAGVFCTAESLLRALEYQGKGYLDVLAGLPAPRDTRVFRSNESFARLFFVPKGQKNLYSLGVWSLMGETSDPKSWKRACHYGADAGMSIVACWDKSKRNTVVAFSNTWSGNTDAGLEAIVAATFGK